MGGTVFPSPAEAHLEVYIVACFFKGIGMHKTVKVRDIGTPSKIQRCVPAWTGMALFFESRERHRGCSVFLFFFREENAFCRMCFESYLLVGDIMDPLFGV